MRHLKWLYFACLSFNAVAVDDTTTIEETVSTPFHISASSHFLFTNKKDEFDPLAPEANTLRHEGNVRAEYGPVQAETTFNNRFFINAQPSFETGLPPDNNDFVLEKKSLTGSFGVFNVIAGDSYQELGRGIALSLNRNAPFGLDNTLEGIAMRSRPDGADIQVFGGRVNAWDVPLALNPIDNPLSDREMLLAGGSVQMEVNSISKFGVHGFYGLSRKLESTRYDRRYKTIGMSLNIEGISEGLDFYGETNLLSQTRTASDGEFGLPEGRGTYASLSWAPNSFKAKVEVKDYQKYQFDFRRPPTLEEDVVETTNIDDTTAVRSQVEYLFPETRTSLLASFMAGDDRLLETRVHHGVIGAKFPITNVTTWEARAGYRWHPQKAQLMHGLLRSKIKTFRGQSLELGFRKQITDTDMDLIPTRDDRNYFDVTYNLNERFSVGGGFEYVPSNVEEMGTKFFNGNVTYKSGNFNGRAFIGQTSGGPQCSGGICRIIPPYSGAMVDMTVSF